VFAIYYRLANRTDDKILLSTPWKLVRVGRRPVVSLNGNLSGMQQCQSNARKWVVSGRFQRS